MKTPNHIEMSNSFGTFESYTNQDKRTHLRIIIKNKWSYEVIL